MIRKEGSNPVRNGFLNGTSRLNGMVDVSEKEVTRRTAKAQAVVKLKKGVLNLIKSQQILKGDVLEQAKVAGIMASKRTSDILCLFIFPFSPCNAAKKSMFCRPVNRQ